MEPMAPSLADDDDASITALKFLMLEVRDDGWDRNKVMSLWSALQQWHRDKHGPAVHTTDSDTVVVRDTSDDSESEPDTSKTTPRSGAKLGGTKKMNARIQQESRSAYISFLAWAHGRIAGPAMSTIQEAVLAPTYVEYKSDLQLVQPNLGHLSHLSRTSIWMLLDLFGPHVITSRNLMGTLARVMPESPVDIFAVAAAVEEEREGRAIRWRKRNRKMKGAASPLSLPRAQDVEVVLVDLGLLPGTQGVVVVDREESRRRRKRRLMMSPRKVVRVRPVPRGEFVSGVEGASDNYTSDMNTNDTATTTPEPSAETYVAKTPTPADTPVPAKTFVSTTRPKLPTTATPQSESDPYEVPDTEMLDDTTPNAKDISAKSQLRTPHSNAPSTVTKSYLKRPIGSERQQERQQVRTVKKARIEGIAEELPSSPLKAKTRGDLAKSPKQLPTSTKQPPRTPSTQLDSSPLSKTPMMKVWRSPSKPKATVSDTASNAGSTGVATGSTKQHRPISPPSLPSLKPTGSPVTTRPTKPVSGTLGSKHANAASGAHAIISALTARTSKPAQVATAAKPAHVALPPKPTARQAKPETGAAPKPADAGPSARSVAGSTPKPPQVTTSTSTISSTSKPVNTTSTPKATTAANSATINATSTSKHANAVPVSRPAHAAWSPKPASAVATSKSNGGSASTPAASTGPNSDTIRQHTQPTTSALHHTESDAFFTFKPADATSKLAKYISKISASIAKPSPSTQPLNSDQQMAESLLFLREGPSASDIAVGGRRSAPPKQSQFAPPQRDEDDERLRALTASPADSRAPEPRPAEAGKGLEAPDPFQATMTALQSASRDRLVAATTDSRAAEARAAKAGKDLEALESYHAELTALKNANRDRLVAATTDSRAVETRAAEAGKALESALRDAPVAAPVLARAVTTSTSTATALQADSIKPVPVKGQPVKGPPVKDPPVPKSNSAATATSTSTKIHTGNSAPFKSVPVQQVPKPTAPASTAPHSNKSLNTIPSQSATQTSTPILPSQAAPANQTLPPSRPAAAQPEPKTIATPPKTMPPKTTPSGPGFSKTAPAVATPGPPAKAAPRPSSGTPAQITPSKETSWKATTSTPALDQSGINQQGTTQIPTTVSAGTLSRAGSSTTTILQPVVAPSTTHPPISTHAPPQSKPTQPAPKTTVTTQKSDLSDGLPAPEPITTTTYARSKPAALGSPELGSSPIHSARIQSLPKKSMTKDPIRRPAPSPTPITDHVAHLLAMPSLQPHLQDVEMMDAEDSSTPTPPAQLPHTSLDSLVNAYQSLLPGQVLSDDAIMRLLSRLVQCRSSVGLVDASELSAILRGSRSTSNVRGVSFQSQQIILFPIVAHKQWNMYILENHHLDIPLNLKWYSPRGDPPLFVNEIADLLCVMLGPLDVRIPGQTETHMALDNGDTSGRKSVKITRVQTPLQQDDTDSGVHIVMHAHCAVLDTAPVPLATQQEVVTHRRRLRSRLVAPLASVPYKSVDAFSEDAAFFPPATLFTDPMGGERCSLATWQALPKGFKATLAESNRRHRAIGAAARVLVSLLERHTSIVLPYAQSEQQALHFVKGHLAIYRRFQRDLGAWQKSTPDLLALGKPWRKVGMAKMLDDIASLVKITLATTRNRCLTVCPSKGIALEPAREQPIDASILASLILIRKALDKYQRISEEESDGFKTKPEMPCRIFPLYSI